MYHFRLERTDGSPADPPTYWSTVVTWRQGDNIPLSAERSLCVIGPRRRRQPASSRKGRKARPVESMPFCGAGSVPSRGDRPERPADADSTSDGQVRPELRRRLRAAPSARPGLRRHLHDGHRPRPGRGSDPHRLDGDNDGLGCE